MSATTMISGDALTVLGSMFNVDSHKSITVEGLKLGLHLPLIETLLCRSKFQGTTTLIQKYTQDFILILFLKVIIS
jgi:hypothetical protein